MFKHKCSIKDQRIVAERVNPLNPTWEVWTVFVCSKCKAVRELQHHSEEEMHGGDLEINALPTPDYLRHIYGLAEGDIDLVLAGKKKARCYNRYTKLIEEIDV